MFNVQSTNTSSKSRLRSSLLHLNILNLLEAALIMIEYLKLLQLSIKNIITLFSTVFKLHIKYDAMIESKNLKKSLFWFDDLLHHRALHCYPGFYLLAATARKMKIVTHLRHTRINQSRRDKTDELIMCESAVN